MSRGVAEHLPVSRVALVDDSPCTPLFFVPHQIGGAQPATQIITSYTKVLLLAGAECPLSILYPLNIFFYLRLKIRNKY